VLVFRVLIIRHRNKTLRILSVFHAVKKELLSVNLHMLKLHYLISNTTLTCQVCVSTVLLLIAGK